MAGQTLNDVIDANMQTLREGPLPTLFQRNQNLAVQRCMKGTETYRITKTPGGSDFRIPLEFGPAGLFGAQVFDGTQPLGLGVGFNVNQLTQTYFGLRMGFQIAQDVVWGTEMDDLSRFNVWKKTIAEGMENFAYYEDASWQNLGGNDGQIGTVAAVSGSSPNYTVTMTTDVGARMMLPLMRFEIVDSALANWKTYGASPDGLPYVNPGSLEYQGYQVQFTVVTALAVAPAVGDIFYFQGAVTGTSQTVFTINWLDGQKYFNTTTTSGNLLGLSRTTFPVLNSSAITTGGTVTPDMTLALKNLIRVRAGNKTTPKMIGLIGPQQEAVMNSTVQAMQTYFRDKKTQDQIDPLPNYDSNVEGITWGGQTHFYNGHQPASRIDYIVPEDWCRVYLNEKPGADFYKEQGSGDTFFSQYASNGSPYPVVLFYLISTLNYACFNPQNAGLITNLSSPSSNYNY